MARAAIVCVLLAACGGANRRAAPPEPPCRPPASSVPIDGPADAPIAEHIPDARGAAHCQALLAFRDGTTIAVARQILARHDARVIGGSSREGTAVLLVWLPGSDVEDFLAHVELLGREPQVHYALPDVGGGMIESPPPPAPEQPCRAPARTYAIEGPPNDMVSAHIPDGAFDARGEDYEVGPGMAISRCNAMLVFRAGTTVAEAREILGRHHAVIIAGTSTGLLVVHLPATGLGDMMKRVERLASEPKVEHALPDMGGGMIE